MTNAFKKHLTPIYVHFQVVALNQNDSIEFIPVKRGEGFADNIKVYFTNVCRLSIKQKIFAKQKNTKT